MNSNNCLEKEAIQSLHNCLQSLHDEERLPKPSHEFRNIPVTEQTKPALKSYKLGSFVSTDTRICQKYKWAGSGAVQMTVSTVCPRHANTQLRLRGLSTHLDAASAKSTNRWAELTGNWTQPGSPVPFPSSVSVWFCCGHTCQLLQIGMHCIKISSKLKPAFQEGGWRTCMKLTLGKAETFKLPGPVPRVRVSKQLLGWGAEQPSCWKEISDPLSWLHTLQRAPSRAGKFSWASIYAGMDFLVMQLHLIYPYSSCKQPCSSEIQHIGLW